MVGGPCDFSVSPSPLGLDFGTLDLGLTKIFRLLGDFGKVFIWVSSD